MRWIVIVAAAACGIVVVLGVLHMKTVSAEAHEMVDAGAILLDVRTPAEFQQGHLPGAINIPVDQVSARASELGPVTTAVVTYCLSGGRSARAAATLKQLGFDKVLNLGPKTAW